VKKNNSNNRNGGAFTEVPFQLIPGGFAPNPYVDGQGYAMTTFLVPAGGQKNEQV